MTSKEEKFFSQSTWYHGTTLAEWKSICEIGIQAAYNIGYSLDYGNGFYMSPSEADTQIYAVNTVKYNGSTLADDNIPIVIVFGYTPLTDILSGTPYHYFKNYDGQ